MNDQVEVLNEQGDADFDAGFTSSPEPTTTPEPETREPASNAAETPKYAQITEEQLKELLSTASAINEIKGESKKLFDNAFGQLGGMKQRIEQMQSATPAGEPVVLTDDDFAELQADYPDFAKSQMNVMNKILGKLKGTGSDSAAIERIVSERVAGQTAAVRQEIIDSSLEVVFPDWKKEVKSEGFTKWMSAQSADVQALAASDNVGHAAKMLKLYEAAKNVQPPSVKPSTRQKQIEAAVAPKGIGGHVPAPTEDDDFNAGFNSR